MTEQSVADVLNAAADLVEPDGAHAKYALARDAAGRPCDPDSDIATSWCAVGALYKVEGGYDVARQAFDHFLGAVHPVDFNNDRTQAEVVATHPQSKAAA